MKTSLSRLQAGRRDCVGRHSQGSSQMIYLRCGMCARRSCATRQRPSRVRRPVGGRRARGARCARSGPRTLLRQFRVRSRPSRRSGPRLSVGGESVVSDRSAVDSYRAVTLVERSGRRGSWGGCVSMRWIRRVTGCSAAVWGSTVASLQVLYVVRHSYALSSALHETDYCGL